MFNSLIKILSLCLLISITFSFPVLQSEGQYQERAGTSEITFFGKEETKWAEKREVPLPVVLVQGTKEEARVDSFDLREDSIGPTKKDERLHHAAWLCLFKSIHIGYGKSLYGG